MFFERLPNCNDYKLNNKLTWRRREETGAAATVLQSLALAGLLAGLLTLLALLFKHIALL